MTCRNGKTNCTHGRFKSGKMKKCCPKTLARKAGRKNYKSQAGEGQLNDMALKGIKWAGKKWWAYTKKRAAENAAAKKRRGGGYVKMTNGRTKGKKRRKRR